LECAFSNREIALFLPLDLLVSNPLHSKNPQPDYNMDSKPAARPFPSSLINSNSPAVSMDTVPTSNLSHQQHPSAFVLTSQSQQIPWMPQQPVRALLPPPPPAASLPPPVPQSKQKEFMLKMQRQMDMLVASDDGY
jgi:hypothetical protein